MDVFDMLTSCRMKLSTFYSINNRNIILIIHLACFPPIHPQQSSLHMDWERDVSIIPPFFFFSFPPWLLMPFWGVQRGLPNLRLRHKRMVHWEAWSGVDRKKWIFFLEQICSAFVTSINMLHTFSVKYVIVMINYSDWAWYFWCPPSSQQLCALSRVCDALGQSYSNMHNLI